MSSGMSRPLGRKCKVGVERRGLYIHGVNNNIRMRAGGLTLMLLRRAASCSDVFPSCGQHGWPAFRSRVHGQQATQQEAHTAMSGGVQRLWHGLRGGLRGSPASLCREAGQPSPAAVRSSTR